MSRFLGLDFGTESVRAVIVDRAGRLVGSAVAPYCHGQIVPGSAAAAKFFPTGLPQNFALQHPSDWLDAAGIASREAVRAASGGVSGIGVDFTSCTVLPCTRAGVPLCLANHDRADPHTWPKLWKHHGAISQTDRINALARQRGESWLDRYGGIVGLEWLLPKMLEAIESSASAAAAPVWLEAGDWFVWQLIGAHESRVDAAELPRSTCQAGYKGLWSAEHGFPSEEFCSALHPSLGAARRSALPGKFYAPGTPVGGLCSSMAKVLGVEAGVPVSAAIIDAHAGVPGAGVAGPGVLVMVMGTSGCHMLMSERERLIPGVAGVVRDGILPGYFGYETGQAAMGDAFDFVRRLTGSKDFAGLDAAAARLEAGAGGVLAVDWFNGCRTPLMDGSLKGAVLGLTLQTTPAQVYRAVLEASAMGLRWIVDTLREGGVDVSRFVATGGLPTKNPLFASIVASVLGHPIEIHAAEQGPALGAAIIGALASGEFASAEEAVECTAGRRSALGPSRVVEPIQARAYDNLYHAYRRATDELASMRWWGVAGSDAPE